MGGYSPQTYMATKYGRKTMTDTERKTFDALLAALKEFAQYFQDSLKFLTPAEAATLAKARAAIEAAEKGKS